MKKNIVFLLFLTCFFICSAAIAGDKATDSVRGITGGCGDNSGQVKFYNNEYIFCSPPNTRRCTESGNDHWVKSGCSERMCDGFPSSGFDSDSMVYVPSDASKNPSQAQKIATCWKYECDSKHLIYGKKCIDAAECKAMYGYIPSSNNKECVSDNWCDNNWRDNYNPLHHVQTTVGNCNQYKCKPGTCFRSSADTSTCIKADSNSEYCGDDGIATACQTGEYYSSADKKCASYKIATMSQMRACFDCIFEDGFRECVESNGSIRTKCNSSSASSGGNINMPDTITGTDGKVSCATGTWLAGNANVCSLCSADFYCTGGSYTVQSGAQGRIACPADYPKSAIGNKSQNTCFKECSLKNYAFLMSGSDYYSASDTCTIANCISGYSISRGQCVAGESSNASENSNRGKDRNNQTQTEALQ